jgi:hypothetical protein
MSSVSGLTSIPPDFFKNSTNITNFSKIFSSCTSLSGSIPIGQFGNNVWMTNEINRKKIFDYLKSDKKLVIECINEIKNSHIQRHKHIIT